MKRAATWLIGLIAGFYIIFVVLGALVPNGARLGVHGPKTVEILLTGGAIHYDFLLPLDELTKTQLGWLADAGVHMGHPQARWLVVGWGAREFYTTTGGYSDVRLGAVWRGLTGDGAVMRVDLAGDIQNRTKTLSVRLSDAQYADLLDHIEGSFAEGTATPPLPVQGLSYFDTFLPPRGALAF